MDKKEGEQMRMKGNGWKGIEKGMDGNGLKWKGIHGNGWAWKKRKGN
jgi:hypothetical protein